MIKAVLALLNFLITIVINVVAGLLAIAIFLAIMLGLSMGFFWLDEKVDFLFVHYIFPICFGTAFIACCYLVGGKLIKRGKS